MHCILCLLCVHVKWNVQHNHHVLINDSVSTITQHPAQQSSERTAQTDVIFNQLWFSTIHLKAQLNVAQAARRFGSFLLLLLAWMLSLLLSHTISNTFNHNKLIQSEILHFEKSNAFAWILVRFLFAVSSSSLPSSSSFVYRTVFIPNAIGFFLSFYCCLLLLLLLLLVLHQPYICFDVVRA